MSTIKFTCPDCKTIVSQDSKQCKCDNYYRIIGGKVYKRIRISPNTHELVDAYFCPLCGQSVTDESIEATGGFCPSCKENVVKPTDMINDGDGLTVTL